MLTEAAHVPAAGHYDTRTIVLHWLTAVLVALQWMGGQTIDWFPRGMLRTDARSVHIVVGLALGVVILVRLLWRTGEGTRLPPANHGVLQALATAMNYLLYALLITTVSLGFLNAYVRGDNIFGLFSIRKLVMGGPDFKGTVEDLHGWSANTLLVVAGLHAVAGLWHHYGLRDGVLVRMIPALRPRTRATTQASP
jgi:cytochrome b561